MKHLLSIAICVLASLGCGGSAAEETQAALEVQGGDVALPLRTNDPAYDAAIAALQQGRPWRATRILAPALADSTRRTPELLMLAATAASRWDGWRTVRELLEGEAWLDTRFGGEGRELLARAGLGLELDSLARTQAALAVLSAATLTERGERLTLLARAYDRLGLLDSARIAYAGAAELLPHAADWLRLRAAAVEADSSSRHEVLGEVRGRIPRTRIARVEATARERTGDLAGAARAWEAAGEPVSAMRVRLARGVSSTQGAAIRRELMEIIRTQPGTGDAGRAVEVLDEYYGALSPREELAVARSAARGGPAWRARTGFLRAFRAGVGTAEDRYRYARVLFSMRRFDEAAAQFARVRAPRSLAAEARFERGRALLRGGKITAARAQLRAVLRDDPNETEPAASALFLLADLATDERRDAAARAAYLDVAKRWPSSTLAPTARYRAALIAYVDGRHRAAAREFEELAERYPRSDVVPGAIYWAGRSWAAAGDTAAARARWRRVLDQSPMSYYASRAARRLDVEPWSPPAAPDSFPVIPEVDSAMARAALLEALGMDFEAGLEYDALVEASGSSLDRLLATARAFRDRGITSRAITLGWRAIDRGAPRDARAYRLVYPVTHLDVLTAVADERGLDPTLMAALIRQESWFNPRATSSAGARGLMQVMPRVGGQVARSLDYPVWDPVLLYQPDVNIQLGAAHLATLVGQYDELAHVLAAYNAGGSRVARWVRKRGASDPEMFTERIPFDETRDYVRIVMRNRDLYDALYEW